VRFISHRDLARAFERAFRIVRLPLAFTGGFSPRPRVSFGLALPVGAESEAEYLDVELTEPVDLDATVEALNRALPEGIAVTGIAELDERAMSLQEAVISTTWRLEVCGASASLLTEGIERALASSTLAGTRRRKGVETVEDLRPAIRSMAVTGETERGVVVEMELTTQPRSVRPGEVLAVLGDFEGLDGGFVLRTHQWIERDGARREPLDADTRPRAVEVRV
jgi:radical SAM-linked protein